MIQDSFRSALLHLLLKHGLIRSALKPVKILGNGELKLKVNITATSFSKAAKEKIEKLGGKVTEQ